MKNERLLEQMRNLHNELLEVLAEPGLPNRIKPKLQELTAACFDISEDLARADGHDRGLIAKAWTFLAETAAVLTILDDN